MGITDTLTSVKDKASGVKDTVANFPERWEKGTWQRTALKVAFGVAIIGLVGAVTMATGGGGILPFLPIYLHPNFLQMMQMISMMQMLGTAGIYIWNAFAERNPNSRPSEGSTLSPHLIQMAGVCLIATSFFHTGWGAGANLNFFLGLAAFIYADWKGEDLNYTPFIHPVIKRKKPRESHADDQLQQALQPRAGENAWRHRIDGDMSILREASS